MRLEAPRDGVRCRHGRPNYRTSRPDTIDSGPPRPGEAPSPRARRVAPWHDHAPTPKLAPAAERRGPQQVLSLSAGADSVELKLTVPEADHRSAVAALGLDPLDAQIRLVSFFDTPDLALNRAGRDRARAARAGPRGRLRGQAAARSCRTQLPDDLRRRRAWSSSSTRCPAATSARRAEGPARRRTGGQEACRGQARTRKLFSKAQRAFYAAHAPEGLELDDLHAARPDLRAQAQLDPARLRPQARRPRCGSTPTARASSSSRPSARRRRCSRSRPRPGVPDRGSGSTSRASSRRRRSRRLSSSRGHLRAG